ncbi:MAG: RES family NAD+ phosphorylase [Pseudomonadota bacterium]
MVHARRRRDSALIDAIEAHKPIEFEGGVWRVVRDGRSPLACGSAGGRWDDGTFDVLYTSQERDGAIAEMHFHLSRGQPIFPSKVRYRLHELHASLSRALKLVDMQALAALGLDTARYGQLSYERMGEEYPRSQDIAEVAHFLEFDGLIVPSARWPCLNTVLFCDRVPPSRMDTVADHGLVDWDDWATRNVK